MMNQEMNNLNQNNFNSEGNNGIPNNQPLNNLNQDFNNGINQVSQQNINGMGEVTINNKPPKNIKLPLFIGIGAAIAVIVAAFILIFSSNSDKSKLKDKGSGSNEKENIQSNLSNPKVDITGKVKFIKKYEGYNDIDKCGDFWVLENEKQKIVINSVGDVLAAVSSEYDIEYCNADGTILIEEDMEIFSVYRNNKKIHHFYSVDDEHTYFMYYDNDVLYYNEKEQESNERSGMVAYDLNNNKVLWKLKDGYNPIVLDDVVLLNDENMIVSKKTGELIDKTNDEYTVYGSYSSYYARVYRVEGTKWLSKVEIYDYDSNLISSQTFEKKCWFKYIMSNGNYVVTFDEPSNMKVYDHNSKLLKEIDDAYDYAHDRLEMDGNTIVTKINLLDNDKISVLESRHIYSIPHLVFYGDGRIVEIFSMDSSTNKTGVHYLSYQLMTNQRTFVYGYTDTDDDWQHEHGLLLNFLTGETVEIKDTYSYGKELNGGKYFSIARDSDNSVNQFFDYDLKKLDFEFKGYFHSIHDEWILSKKKIYNILTGDSYDIDIVDGGITLNEYSLFVVDEEDNFYLYQFV